MVIVADRELVSMKGNLNELKKELIKKYFNISEDYIEFTIENGVITIDFSPSCFINYFKDIRRVNQEELISLIQKDLLKTNVLKFYEYFNVSDGEFNENNKMYAIDVLNNNTELTLKYIGKNKLLVYIQAYLDLFNSQIVQEETI